MGVPTRVIKRGMFGKPTLQWLKNNGTESNGRATWTKEWRRYGQYTAKLSPGYQTDDDYGAISFPVNNMPIEDLKSIKYVYRMGATEVVAPNVTIHVYDPNDVDNRADITFTHTYTDLPKSSGWRKFHVTTALDGFFYYGNNIPSTVGLTQHDNTSSTIYTLAQFQADGVFSTYVIDKITIEYGYYSTGYLSAAHICLVNINGEDLLLEPSEVDLAASTNDAQAEAQRTIPTWTFGEPQLAFNKNSVAYWSRGMSDPRYHMSGTGWKACLHGRLQTGDDWAALAIPVNEMPLAEFNTAYWSYVMTTTQSMGANIVFWCHDPTNFIYRAEITQDATIAGVTKTSGRNAHVFNPATSQMFYYGEITGTPDTCPTAGTKYTWAQFQGDSVFSKYTIYKITIEMGWEASGTFDQVFVGDLILNGTNIPLKPRSDADLMPVHTYYTGSSDITTGNGTVAPKTPFQLLSVSIHLDVNPGEAAPFIIQVLRDNDKHATYYDEIIHTSDMYVPTDALSRHPVFGEGYEYAEDDVIDVLWNGNAKNYGLVITWKPL